MTSKNSIFPEKWKSGTEIRKKWNEIRKNGMELERKLEKMERKNSNPDRKNSNFPKIHRITIINQKDNEDNTRNLTADRA